MGVPLTFKTHIFPSPIVEKSLLCDSCSKMFPSAPADVRLQKDNSCLKSSGILGSMRSWLSCYFNVVYIKVVGFFFSTQHAKSHILFPRTDSGRAGGFEVFTDAWIWMLGTKKNPENSRVPYQISPGKENPRSFFSHQGFLSMLWVMHEWWSCTWKPWECTGDT